MVAGGGIFHYADTGEDLVKTFSSIASNTEGANRLAASALSKIMEGAINKLILDYL
jgi:hypothetical protein